MARRRSFLTLLLDNVIYFIAFWVSIPVALFCMSWLPLWVLGDADMGLLILVVLIFAISVVISWLWHRFGPTRDKDLQ